MRNTLGQRFQNRIDVPVWLERDQLTFAEKVLNTHYANLIGYWPMWEPSGGISYDLSSQGNNGAYFGVTLGQPGIGDGATCPFFPGAANFNNVYSAGLAADFNGDEGTLLVPIKVDSIADWTDGVERRFANFLVDGNNFILLRRPAANNQIDFFYKAGGTQELRSVVGLSTTDWMYIALTWSAAADEVIAYIDAVQQGAIMTVLGVWAGALAANSALFGANTTAGANPWFGNEAHAALFNRALTQPELSNLVTP